MDDDAAVVYDGCVMVGEGASRVGADKARAIAGVCRTLTGGVGVLHGVAGCDVRREDVDVVDKSGMPTGWTIICVAAFGAECDAVGRLYAVEHSHYIDIEHLPFIAVERVCLSREWNEIASAGGLQGQESIHPQAHPRPSFIIVVSGMESDNMPISISNGRF